MSLALPISAASRATVMACGLGLLLLCCTAVPAADFAPWLPNHAQAVAQARKQGKLLLVVHFSGDFAASPADGVESKLYRQLIVTDARVAAALADRFVVSFRHVGDARGLSPLNAFPVLETKQPAKRNQVATETTTASRKATEMAIAYICLPDERVLHFVPGFVSSQEFLGELNWAEASYSSLLKVSEPEMAAALCRLHSDMLATIDREAFAKLFPTRWPDDSPPPEYSTVDLPQGLAAAHGIACWSAQQRLGARGIAPQAIDRRLLTRNLPVARSETLAALAAHGRLGADFAHLVLSEFPLVYLSDLAGPAYEACTGHRYWRVSSHREELAQWWTDCEKQGRRTMLIVAPEVSVEGFDGESEPLTEAAGWSSEEAARLAELWRFSAKVVSIDELGTLLTDAKLPPLAYDPVAGPPRFILHDARGIRCGELAAQDATTEKLAAMLRSAVGSGGGERAHSIAEQGSNVKE